MDCTNGQLLNTLVLSRCDTRIAQMGRPALRRAWGRRRSACLKGARDGFEEVALETAS